MRSFLSFDDGVDDLPHPPRIVASGLRFNLAEDRIRDFLMGENLYGDPSLAIREAYQNALDAVRLRTARREYLRLPALPASPEVPEIEFIQGIDARGRAYIDCVDRGAGMGVEELTLAFCQAGVRAADLYARAAEAAAFASADPPVELFQNSRFGIGVMSYFMIADEVTVSTARLDPDGSIGNVLSMHVSGPESTFDAHDLGPAESPGTRVRLWLKPSASVSAVSTLRDLVIMCPVHLRAADQRGLEHRWAPDELNHASSAVAVPLPQDVSVGVPGTLWWTRDSHAGAILADGIWSGQLLTGMIVNLHGRHAPTLTADRRTIVSIDWALIEGLAVGMCPQAVETSWHLVGDPKWLTSIVMRFPRLADALLADAARRSDRFITLKGRDTSISVSGYLPGDEKRSLGGAPAWETDWRLARHRAAGLFDRVGLAPASSCTPEPALPSDSILLGTLNTVLRFGVVETVDRWFPSPASIYEAERLLRYPVARIVARARTLGLPLPDGADDAMESNDTVRTALSFSRRQNDDMTFRAVSAFDLLQTAWQLGQPVEDVIDELERRSIELDEGARSPATTHPSAAILMAASRGLNGIAPWLDTAEEISIRHLNQAARMSGSTYQEMLDGLLALGFSELPRFRFSSEPTADDEVMLSQDLDGQFPLLRPDRSTNVKHLRKAAKLLGRSEDELRERFREFGVVFSEHADSFSPERATKREFLRSLDLSPEHRKQVRPRHLRMISDDDDGRAPWLDPSTIVPAWLVAVHASRKHPIDDVLADYRWLGFETEDPRTSPPRLIPGSPARAQSEPIPG
ncbi:wHTH domain-containing protein [Herbiconiux liangxiaofengii]|uniref:wHTH domain-containing protein n=1 Tax=Herbiconiux liangxiaofengii TaxID=3342795 RepID=UPI0035B89CE4